MTIDFNKNTDGLIPAIIQDANTKNVLMLGYMNEEAFSATREKGKVTFYSRSKNRLWTKGEESGNFLEVVSIIPDCDNDTLLVKANPVGPVCHTGNDTCFAEKNSGHVEFLAHRGGVPEIVEVAGMEEVEGALCDDAPHRSSRSMSACVKSKNWSSGNSTLRTSRSRGWPSLSKARQSLRP